MRILHVHSGNIFGGVERILVTLAKGSQSSRQSEHAFALCFRGRLQKELAAAGAEVFDLGELHLSKPWQLWVARSRLRKLLIEHRFNLAIVHSAWSHFAFVGTLKALELPTLFWLHSKASGRSLLERAAQLRFPDHIISVSRAVDETAAALFPGVNHDVVHTPFLIVEEALDPGERQRLRESLGARTSDVVMLQASRMEAWKGHAVLLRALNRLRDNPNWRCWIAGGADRPEESEYLSGLQTLADQLDISARVQFLGPRNDVLTLMGAADIYCQANLEGEGFSIAFLEASHAGLPIVTSALGGAMEIVDSQNGILLPPGDTAALATALESLVNDPHLRHRLGSAGAARAREKCDPSRQFGALEEVFHKVAA